MTNAWELVEARAAWLAGFLERHPARWIAAFSLVYFPLLALAARATPFWYDELFTYYVAMGPDLDWIMSLLWAGIDYYSPAYYLLEHAVTAVVGDPHVGLRLPSIAGYWLACVCLYVIVRRRSSPLWGAIAALSPFLLDCFKYTLWARSYGLMLGSSAFALLAWQSVGEGEHRARWLLALAMGLAAAVCSNYYAALILFPLGAGELVRTFRNRRVDWGAWAALVTGGAVALAHLPLIISGLGHFAEENWSSPYLTVTLTIYADLIHDLGFPLALFLLLTALWLASPGRPAAPARENAFRLDEVVVFAGLLLLPFIGQVAAIVANKLLARYVLATVLGFGILGPLVAYRVTRGSATVGVALLLVSLGAATWQTLDALGGLERPALPAMKDVGYEELPLVIDDRSRFFEVWHYASPAEAQRLRFYGGFLPLDRFIHIPILPLNEGDGPFLLYVTDDQRPAEVLPKVVALGARPRLLSFVGGERVYYVEIPDSARSGTRQP